MHVAMGADGVEQEMRRGVWHADDVCRSIRNNLSMVGTGIEGHLGVRGKEAKGSRCSVVTPVRLSVLPSFYYRP